MRRTGRQIIVGGALLAVLAGGSWFAAGRLSGDGSTQRAKKQGPVPVEIAPVRHGPIERRRTLSGTLEPAAQFVVAPKVGGRLVRVAVDLGDTVERGQVVAELDDDEFVQAAAEARAALAVARAERKAAESALVIADRGLGRARDLVEEGVASRADLDTASAEHLRAEAAVEVAASEVARARATLRAAEVRASYTRVTADWPGDDETRSVGARYADEGETVAANTPLLSIVDLDPVTVAVFATEHDYPDLQPGKRVTLTTDAYPGERFPARVARVAPVFRADSRQARVELSADNPEGRLKPGMFVRAEIVLDRIEGATIVDRDALVTRNGSSSVFVVSNDETTVKLVPVTVGIRQDGHVQVDGDGIVGHVVTLGQQQLEDGSAITVPPTRTSRSAPASSFQAEKHVPPESSASPPGTEGGS